MNAQLTPSAARALARGDRMARFRRPLRGTVCPRCTRREQWGRCAICNPPPVALLVSEILRGVRVRSGLRQLRNRCITALEDAAARAGLVWFWPAALEVPAGKGGAR